MRYSIVKSLVDMCQTLLEAENYLEQSPDPSQDGGVYQGGQAVLNQIQSELRSCRDDLTDNQLLLRIAAIEEKWENMHWGTRLFQEIQQFKWALPRGLRYTLRAVFLAELGQKWDSMDSVYRFMEQDPRFDPVVVLTPIIRRHKRPNGEEVQDVLYEDYLTGLGIPFYHYNSYVLEQDCPDVVLSSQPYEAAGIPPFWPQNIVPYSRLVYLPYFVPGMLWDEFPITLCQLPMQTMAWRVIGSNEKELAFYQKYHRYGGKNMRVLGLPKLDPLKKLKEEGVPFPPEWEKLKGKRLILWNTWYDLTAGTSIITCYEAIFEWLEQHPEFGIVFRPHPMMEIVTKLHYPQLYPTYKQCMQMIKNHQSMVVDTTRSTDAGFYWSEALVSEPSSLLEQYLMMDKPCLAMKNKVKLLDEEIVSSRWMEKGDGVQDMIAFLDRRVRHEDGNAELRRVVREEDMPLADGQSGRRVSEMIWNDICREDGIKTE